MTLKEIAIRNMLRRKGKAAFILAGLVIGVATVIALTGFVDAMSRDITSKLEKFGANILIVPRSESLDLNYGGMAVGGVSFEMAELHETDLGRIQTIKNVRNIAATGAVVLGTVDVSGQKILLAGVDFSVTPILKPWWRMTGNVPGEEGVLVGAEVARVMGLAPGSTVGLKGRELTVAGVLTQTGSQDDRLIFTQLSTAQELLGKQGKVSMVEVAALCTECPIDDMVSQLAAALPGARVMAIQQVVKGRMETLAHFGKFSYGISGVVLLIGGLVVLVTMMGSVRERTREIGIFRAIGFRRSHVVRIVFMEAAVLSAISGVCGYLLGMASVAVAVRLFGADPATAVTLSLVHGAVAVGIAVALGIGSAFYPAIMASRLDPNEALRAL